MPAVSQTAMEIFSTKHSVVSAMNNFRLDLGFGLSFAPTASELAVNGWTARLAMDKNEMR